MELTNFLKKLKRYKGILIFVPILTGIIAFFISRNLPDKYVSHARLASAMADKSQQLVSGNAQEDSKINLEFDNLLQTLTLNKIMDRVSYKLILHDLDSTKPFRKPSAELAALSPQAKEEARKTLTAYYNDRKSLNLADPKEKALSKLLKGAKYDYASLKKTITASRMEGSQYINLEYESENPQLSAFVLNTLSEEFITYYTTVIDANKNQSLRYLDSVLQQRQASLAKETEALKQYKIANGILNIDDQAKTIYGELADLETRRGTAEKDMVAYNMALKNIDSRFSPENRKYFESASAGHNSEIVAIKDQIKSANDAYVASGFNEKYKGQLDTLQSRLTTQIHAQSDNYATNPTAAKENLVTQKLNLEVSRDLAQHSVKTLDRELGKLKGNLHRLVPNLATIQSYQAKIEVASKEYSDILQKYNQASLEANNNAPVRIAEKAIAGDPVPSKKIILVALSSIASFLLCVFAIFVMFYFDNTIETSEQLQDLVDIQVLGSLNSLNGNSMSLHELWERAPDKNSQVFKNSLRSIRYEIENKLQAENSVIAITSLDEGEGKTFFTESLAYAFSRVNKKVLIIDGNFMHPDISNTIKGPNYIESFLLNNSETKMVDNNLITVIGNKGGDGSLLELNSSENIKEFFRALKTIYDVIIIESSALDSMNKANAKEWITFADKVVVVFEAGKKLNEHAAKHIHYLKQLGNKLAGMIFNKIASAPSAPNFNLLLDKPKNEEAAVS
ncbi:MAG: lipopolysaccharide biosynthesis protein [Bacteroidota bacterium]